MSNQIKLQLEMETHIYLKSTQQRKNQKKKEDKIFNIRKVYMNNIIFMLINHQRTIINYNLDSITNQQKESKENKKMLVYP